MQHTTNYNLNQWEDGDVVRREDFNADNAAIDAALKSVSDAIATKAEIVFGTYTGDGNASQTINLGRKPRIVLVEPASGVRVGANDDPYGALAAQGHPAMLSTYNVLTLDDTGFTAYYRSGNSYSVYLNKKNYGYYYLAIF